MIELATAYHIDNNSVLTEHDRDDSVLKDPRGIVWCWEPPNPRATYIMGIDPTVGITSWSRHMRSRDDYRTDNGAIEIIRRGVNGKPDAQVCEYVAPIDPEDLADVANVLGRMYCGNDESGQCLSIIEVYPGPGLLTQRKMINYYNYYNHYVWKYADSIAPRNSIYLGWQSSPKSVRDLWIRGTRHIQKNQIILRSPGLVEEMCDCEPDMIKMTAKALHGHHDDRVRAILMAIWAAHDWSIEFNLSDYTPKVEEGSQAPDWQASDLTYDEMMDAWEARFDQLSEGSQQ